MGVVRHRLALSGVQLMVRRAVLEQGLFCVPVLNELPDLFLDILFPVAVEIWLDGSALFPVQLYFELALLGWSLCQCIFGFAASIMSLTVNIKSMQPGLRISILRVLLCMDSRPEVQATVTRSHRLFCFFYFLFELAILFV